MTRSRILSIPFPSLRSSALAIGAAFGFALLGAALPDVAHAQDYSEFSRARDAEKSRGAARIRPRAARVAYTREMTPREPSQRVATPSERTPRSVLERTLPARPRPAAGASLPEGPVVLVVSLRQQRLSVYSKGQLVETTTISTGTASDPTPSGVFAVIEKSEKHFSNIYRGAPMPFMQRLTMSGVALHSGHVTGRPASHGCVRLPHEYSKRLFAMTKLGARVIISDDDPEPVELRNVALLERHAADAPGARYFQGDA